jgi:hypothetical protein
MKKCEISGCDHGSVVAANGIRVCARCEHDLVSVGFGAVYLGGAWNGVRGAVYTAKQAQVFPGVAAEESL